MGAASRFLGSGGPRRRQLDRLDADQVFLQEEQGGGQVETPQNGFRHVPVHGRDDSLGLDQRLCGRDGVWVGEEEERSLDDDDDDDDDARVVSSTTTVRT